MENNNVKIIYNDFIKEILGSIIPGFFLLICFFCVCILPFSTLFIFTGKFDDVLSFILNSISLLLENLSFFSSIFFVIFILIFSYIAGSVYYRRNINLPNQYSLYRFLIKDYEFLSIINKKRRYFYFKQFRNQICTVTPVQNKLFP